MALAPRDKLELLDVLSRELHQASALSEGTAAFWSARSLDEIVLAQRSPVVTDIRALAVDFWPTDESADDVNQFIAQQRHADRMGDT